MASDKAKTEGGDGEAAAAKEAQTEQGGGVVGKPAADPPNIFRLRVLGRTLEHLGVQMYKRREAAIAELIANAWDAGAKEVDVTVPVQSAYDQKTSEIKIVDKGDGMDRATIREAYLVVGRNRRKYEEASTVKRPVMGRKGIGKLAGFGVANDMRIKSFRDGESVEFTLNVDALKTQDNQVHDVPIAATFGIMPNDEHGTEITLWNLKHVTPIDVANLRESLARRFSRRVRGEMVIRLNGGEIGEPNYEFERRVPKDGLAEAQLSDGAIVRYTYGFAKKVIANSEQRGFTIHVRGKTAQAPPFFFGVEATASGQHGTRYLTGTIEADFLDEGTDDESDVISTDRQEIDWESKKAAALKAWGDKLTRAALIEWVDMRGEKAKEIVYEDEKLKDRVNRLDGTSREQINKFLKELAKVETDSTALRLLADSVVRAYEFRQFTDVIDQLEAVSDDPDQLKMLVSCLGEWKVLESRAILEIINGRLEIVEKFHNVVVNNAPETAHNTGDDNVHDLLAQYPWLIDPEWQVLAEEKTITKQLREWNVKDSGINADRYDFLALAGDGKLKVIDIKRSGHAVEFAELQRLEGYKVKLAKAHKDIEMVLISGGNFNVDDDTISAWRKRHDARLVSWEETYQRVRKHYEHYRAVLTGEVDDPNFTKKEVEVQMTRRILESGTAFRGKEERKKGLGPQTNEYDTKRPAPITNEHDKNIRSFPKAPVDKK